MLKKKSIGIIGLGNMGRAILNGLVLLGAVKKSAINGMDADPSKCRDAKKHSGIVISKTIKEVVDHSDIVLLAVKPQDMSPALDEISACGKERLFVSIAAGITTQKIERILGRGSRVVRVMPNTPALIGEGMSVLCKGRYASKQDLKAAGEIFSSVGKVVELKEKDFDAVTAVSGSGPAYFFYVVEALIDSGVALGLNKETAHSLVLQTALGAVRLLNESKVSPESLRSRVASKGGTTQAAIEVFEKAKVKEIIAQAVGAAAKRSKELSKK